MRELIRSCSRYLAWQFVLPIFRSLGAQLLNFGVLPGSKHFKGTNSCPPFYILIASQLKNQQHSYYFLLFRLGTEVSLID